MNRVTALGAVILHRTFQCHAHKNYHRKICLKKNEEDDDVKDQTARNDE